MKLLCCGDRYWQNKYAIDTAIDRLEERYGCRFDVLIEGECRGADLLSRIVGEERGMTIEPYPANWAQHHRAAGPIRNAKMYREGKPDVIVAFHADLSKSKGTVGMMEIGWKGGTPVWLCNGIRLISWVHLQSPFDATEEIRL